MRAQRPRPKLSHSSLQPRLNDGARLRKSQLLKNVDFKKIHMDVVWFQPNWTSELEGVSIVSTERQFDLITCESILATCVGISVHLLQMQKEEQ